MVPLEHVVLEIPIVEEVVEGDEDAAETFETSQTMPCDTAATSCKEQECTGHNRGGTSKQPRSTHTEEETSPPADVKMGESEKGV